MAITADPGDGDDDRLPVRQPPRFARAGARRQEMVTATLVLQGASGWLVLCPEVVCGEPDDVGVYRDHDGNKAGAVVLPAGAGAGRGLSPGGGAAAGSRRRARRCRPGWCSGGRPGAASAGIPRDHAGKRGGRASRAGRSGPAAGWRRPRDVPAGGVGMGAPGGPGLIFSGECPGGNCCAAAHQVEVPLFGAGALRTWWLP